MLTQTVLLLGESTLVAVVALDEHGVFLGLGGGGEELGVGALRTQDLKGVLLVFHSNLIFQTTCIQWINI